MNQKDRRYYITRLAKEIFVRRAATINFSTDRDLNIPRIVEESIKDAESMIEAEELYVERQHD